MGIMAALGLSQRTARYAGLKAEAVWNAGFVTVVAAFVISRLLLVAFNLHSFLEYPWLVLALPSLTGLGVLITAVFMLGYARWRGLPLLRLIDAAAPCVALLWAFLSLGRVFDGTRDGMTTLVAWRVGDGPNGFVHPVEVYACVAASVVCVVLLRTFHPRYCEGRTAGLGLALAGAAIFFLDFFRLPSDLLSEAWPNAPLDPSQIIGVAMVLTGIALLRRVSAEAAMREKNEATDAV
jgi:phosphatidylglycerol:prolipoprotein diacylglycerol transferase